MAQEIERKFLVVDDSYKQEAYSQSRIVQGYICSARGRTVRVRIRGDKGYLTIKGASNASGMSRYEWEKEISLQEAEELMKLCEPGVIDKTRYLVKSGKHTFEIDPRLWSSRSNAIAIVLLPDPLRPVNQIITLCCPRSSSLSSRVIMRSKIGYI